MSSYFVFVVSFSLPLSTKQVVEAAGDFVPSVLLPPIFQSQTHLMWSFSSGYQGQTRLWQTVKFVQSFQAMIRRKWSVVALMAPPFWLKISRLRNLQNICEIKYLARTSPSGWNSIDFPQNLLRILNTCIFHPPWNISSTFRVFSIVSLEYFCEVKFYFSRVPHFFRNWYCLAVMRPLKV